MESQDRLPLVSELVCGSNHTFIEALLSLVFSFYGLCLALRVCASHKAIFMPFLVYPHFFLAG